ncbi:IS1182 family transposase [Acidiferrimicrobium sp. IK]|uniref:IS1182 family transposase n=1 Tax=Acidiferrimicrobium sp. IK TaxID=2871700 RepID=UPI0021CB4464|nr:IS1182 family transposase [Acidiferrimicrobium sp. IK]MCU4187531.1 IS1182 family transposase [Acidiferrimicrobium sp. IK]
MQGRSESNRELLDAAALCRQLVREGSVEAFLADHRHQLFPDDLFADLFSSGRGRPSIPGDVVATVMVLQALEGLSDRDAARALRDRISWKVACGLALDDEGFDYSVLTYWRTRLRKSDRPERIFDAVRSVIDATGVLRGKTRRALDSTLLDDAVATQDTVTQLIAAIRRVRRVVPGAAEVTLSAHDYDTSGKPTIAWDDPVAKAALVDGLVNDALTLLAAFADDASEAEATSALALLALVAGQDVEQDDTGTWTIVRKVAPDRVISVVDPEARHMHKSRSVYRDGYKAHIAVEPETGLVTAAALTPANAPDGPTGVTLLDGEEPGLQVLADGAYGSGDTLAALRAAKHQRAIKPFPTAPAVPGGFHRDDFVIDHDADTVTCPIGHTVTITPKRHATFGARCRGCPLRSRCTRSKDGRVLRLTPHDHELVESRRAWRDGDFTEDYRRWRPMVERSIAWLVAGNHRRVRFRGVEKNQLGLSMRIAAINLRRLVNLGLAHDGRWMLNG